MKIICFSSDGETGWGVYQPSTQTITPLTHVLSSYLTALQLPNSSLQDVAEQYRHLDRPLDQLEIRPPVLATNKIFCVGLNYGRHVLEAGRDLPEKPSLFLRHLDSFVGHQANVVKPSVSEQFDYEGELVVVIGKAGRHIQESEAEEYVAGYTCMAENSVRDYQKHAAQVTAGKNFDQSGAIGPWIQKAEGMPFPPQLQLTTQLNGQTVQQGSTSDFIFSVPFLIAYISQFTELKPGDLIATGTPEGVGMKRNPPLYMKAGDVLEIELEQVGALKVQVINEMDG